MPRAPSRRAHARALALLLAAALAFAAVAVEGAPGGGAAGRRGAGLFRSSRALRGGLPRRALLQAAVQDPTMADVEAVLRSVGRTLDDVPAELSALPAVALYDWATLVAESLPAAGGAAQSKSSAEEPRVVAFAGPAAEAAGPAADPWAGLAAFLPAGGLPALPAVPGLELLGTVDPAAVARLADGFVQRVPALDAYAKQLSNLTAAIPENPVTAALDATVDEVDGLLDTVLRWQENPTFPGEEPRVTAMAGPPALPANVKEAVEGIVAVAGKVQSPEGVQALGLGLTSAQQANIGKSVASFEALTKQFPAMLLNPTVAQYLAWARGPDWRAHKIITKAYKASSWWAGYLQGYKFRNSPVGMASGLALNLAGGLPVPKSFNLPNLPALPSIL